MFDLGVLGQEASFGKLGSNDVPSISPEPSLPFSQGKTCFIQNYKGSSMNLQNVTTYLHQGVGGPKTSFEQS